MAAPHPPDSPEARIPEGQNLEETAGPRRGSHKELVYVIPRNEQTLEDFQWVLKEIVQLGAEASICAASFVDGLTDDQVEGLFRTARDADYGQIADEAKAVLDAAPPSVSMTDEDRSELETSLTLLKRRFSVVANLDFFGAAVLDFKLNGPFFANYLERSKTEHDCQGIKRVIPRGASLSPLQGAFYLLDLDRGMEGLDVRYFRHMDVILVLCRPSYPKWTDKKRYGGLLSAVRPIPSCRLLKSEPTIAT